MRIEDVKKNSKKERRVCRANLRLYPSQMKFIDDHELSVQAVFDKALEELGYKSPSPEEIEIITKIYVSKKGRSYRNGKVKKRRKRNNRQ